MIYIFFVQLTIITNQGVHMTGLNSVAYDGNAIPMVDAVGVIPATKDEVPETPDIIYNLIVDVPGESRGQFGPVLAWEHKDTPDVWFIYAPHSFKLMNHTEDMLISLLDDYSMNIDNYDPLTPLMTSMLKNNECNWDSLVKAYRANDICASNIIGALVEITMNSTVEWWLGYPAVQSDATVALQSLARTTVEQRKQLSDVVEEYMLAESQFVDVVQSGKSHNSSLYISSQHLRDEKLHNLMDAMNDIIPDIVSEATSEAEVHNGYTIYL